MAEGGLPWLENLTTGRPKGCGASNEGRERSKERRRRTIISAIMSSPESPMALGALTAAASDDARSFATHEARRQRHNTLPHHGGETKEGGGREGEGGRETKKEDSRSADKEAGGESERHPDNEGQETTRGRGRRKGV